ncbi:hypothetical protein TcasGA2_TC034966, partial [Tribolium castaneum]
FRDPNLNLLVFMVKNMNRTRN